MKAHKVIQTLFLRKHVNKLTRDKETYWIQRYSMGKVETDSIQRYVKISERKFEKNWKLYEGSLEKFLISKS